MENEINLITVVNSSYEKIKKNKKTYFLVFLLSYIVSFATYLLIPPVYETSFVGSSKFLEPQVIETSIINLNGLVKDKQFETISESLKIKPEVSRVLFSLSTEKVMPFNPNQVSTNSYFKIKVEATSTQHVKEIQQAVINYISNSQFVAERNKESENGYIILKGKLEEELVELVKLRNEIYVGKKNSEYNIMDPSALNERIIALTEK
ncbi:MAG: hypothetical protein ACKO1F_04665, partial [Flammeovirgaceae bacterium]